MIDRRDRGHGEMGEGNPPLAQIIFRVPGVSPEHFENEKIDPTYGIGSKVAKELVNAEEGGRGSAPRINWAHVIGNIESGKHTGFFVVTSGAIIVTIGAEIIRHGRDIRELINIVKAHKSGNKKEK